MYFKKLKFRSDSARLPAGSLTSPGGSGGDQIYDSSPVTIDSGVFDLHGQSETINILSGLGGYVDSTAAGTNVTLTVKSGGSYAGTIQDSGTSATLALC